MKASRTEKIFAAPIADILARTIATNSLASLGSNPYEIRNALILNEKKQQVRFKNR
ncbi:MAG: hypothetical protein HYZ45_03020 [Burkholderiales bacterium]|nr:hypothetical protein [Burkholderiales bacterium]